MNEEIERYEPMIHSIMNKLNIQYDKDDYMQVGRLAVYSALTAFDAVKGKGATESQFVYTRIQQRMIDEIRKVSRYTSHVSADGDAGMDTGADDDMPTLYYESARRVLDDREMLWLTYTLKGFTVREIASVAGFSASSVKNWRASARVKLRKIYGPED